MSYGFNKTCGYCKLKDTCTDYKHIQHALDKIHTQTDQSGHKGCGNVELQCIINEQKTDLSFSQALEYAKQGKKVARKGWNGRDMFIYIQSGNTINYEQLKNEPKSAIDLREKLEGGLKGTSRYVNGHIDMINAQGQIIVGWVASQTDMLANDWYVVE